MAGIAGYYNKIKYPRTKRKSTTRETWLAYYDGKSLNSNLTYDTFLKNV